MSGNLKSGAKKTGKKPAGKIDRRVMRTRDSLGNALVELMHERPFDEITVQQVLDRARVVRSTFYAHYRDKDDLFLSDVEDFFENFSSSLTAQGADLRRIAPVAELFAHIADVQVFYASMVASGKVNDVLALAQGIFARSIQRRLRLAGLTAEPAQLSAQAHALAGGMFALLSWWLDRGMKPAPKEMDRLFHKMAWKGLRP